MKSFGAIILYLQSITMSNEREGKLSRIVPAGAAECGAAGAGRAGKHRPDTLCRLKKRTVPGIPERKRNIRNVFDNKVMESYADCVKIRT